MNSTATTRLFLSPIEQQLLQKATRAVYDIAEDLSEREFTTTEEAQRFADELFGLATTIRATATRLRAVFR